MTLTRLILKEIGHRRLNFALGIVGVLIAAAVLTAQMTLLRAHDLRTQEILDAKLTATEAEMAKNEDEYRKIMKELGFNLLILPEGQKLEDYYAEGYAGRDMPEVYAAKLAQSGMVTIRHLLPIVEQKIHWPEQGGRPIILAGSRGEIPLGRREEEEPMMAAVPAKSAVVGHAVWSSLGLKAGDSMALLGKQFRVAECRPERGSKDDITVWVELVEAQKLLERQGRINAILALKCHCVGNSLAEIRKAVVEVLPGVQVIELANEVTVRAKARDQAKRTALAAMQAEREYRDELRRKREALAAWLIPFVTVGCAAWVGILTLLNVRERRPEIGILRALGFGSRRIMMVFLTRAVLVGAAGAATGYALGLAVALVFTEVSLGAAGMLSLFRPGLLALVLCSAPFLAALAGWLPALVAAREDPAVVLNEA